MGHKNEIYTKPRPLIECSVAHSDSDSYVMSQFMNRSRFSYCNGLPGDLRSFVIFFWLASICAHFSLNRLSIWYCVFINSSTLLRINCALCICSFSSWLSPCFPSFLFSVFVNTLICLFMLSTAVSSSLSCSLDVTATIWYVSWERNLFSYWLINSLSSFILGTHKSLYECIIPHTGWPTKDFTS